MCCFPLSGRSMAGPIRKSGLWRAHAGARTDARDGKGRGVLHLAVGCSSKMVEKFLGLGAGVEAADKRGRTPLHYSAAKGAAVILICTKRIRVLSVCTGPCQCRLSMQDSILCGMSAVHHHPVQGYHGGSQSTASSM